MPYIAATVTLIVCLFTSPFAEAQGTLWAVYSKPGIEAFEKGKYKDAVKLLEKAVAEIDKAKVANQSTVEVRTVLGRSYRQLSRYGDAVSALAAACNEAREVLKPEDETAISAAYHLVSVYHDRGQDDKSLPFLEWLISICGEKPDSPTTRLAYNLLAKIHIKAKRYDEADAAYRKELDYGLNKFKIRGYYLGVLHEDMARLALLRERPAAAAREFLLAADDYAKDYEESRSRGGWDVDAFVRAADAFKKAEETDAEKSAHQKAETRLIENVEFWSAKANLGKEACNARIYLADFYERRSRFEKAVETLEELHKLWIKEKGEGSAEATGEQLRIASFHTRRKDPAEAEKWLRSALENREKSVGPNSPELATCLNRLASFLSDNGKHEAAEQLLRRNVANCRASGESAHRALAEAILKLAGHLGGRLRSNEGFDLRKEALGLYEKLDGESSIAVADVLDGMAWWARDHSIELPLARRAKEIVESAGDRGGRYHQAVNTLGMANSGNGLHAEAEKCYRECIALDQDREPGSEVKPHLLNNIANTYEQRDRFLDGESYYLQSVRGEEKDSSRPFSLAKYQANLAGLYFRWYRPDDAANFVRKSMELREKHGGKEATLTAKSLSQLAALHARSGEYSVAEGLLDRAAAIRNQHLKPNECEAEVAILFERASLQYHRGQWAECEKSLKELFQLAERHGVDQPLDYIQTSMLGTHGTHMVDASQLAGNMAFERGDPSAAEKFLRKVLDHDVQYHPETGRHADILLQMAKLDIERKEYSAATERIVRAVKIVNKVFGEGHPATANALQARAELDLLQGKASSREALQAVLKIREKDATAKPAILSTKVRLAEADLRFGSKYDETAKQLDGYLVEYLALYGDEHYGRHAILALKAECLAKAGKADAANSIWKDVLVIREKTYGKDHKLTAACRKQIDELKKTN